MYNTIFGLTELNSPYLWIKGKSSKPLNDEMKIYHNGRSEAVQRALSDFGIEDSFARASLRFKEHYHFEIGPSAVSRTTMNTARQAMEYVENKLSNMKSDEKDHKVENLLAELDGCEIRTALLFEKEDSTEKTPVYGNPVKEKEINWRDVRIGFSKDLDSGEKIFVGKMDSYPEVTRHMHMAALSLGMTEETKIIGVADGGNGLSEELKRQFPGMQFILDKSHLRDHFYDTAKELGIKKKDRPQWVNPRVQEISEGNVSKTMQELEEKYEREEEKNERLKRLIGYIGRFKDALNYNDFKGKGFPIGSGEIESAHKSIPQKRLKLPGACWHPDSIDPMLALRILRADDWWDDFWNQRTEELLAA